MPTLELKEHSELPVPMSGAQAVLLNGKVYVGGGVTAHDQAPSKLYHYNLADDIPVWSQMDTSVCRFSLAQYLHQLVLVGGIGKNGLPTNKLWTMFEHGECYEGIPPMYTKRYAASSVGYKKYLLVVGGDESVLTYSSAIEVYDGHTHTWMFAQPLAFLYNRFQGMKSVVIDCNWYLIGGEGQGEIGFWASLDSVIDSCDDQSYPKRERVWKNLPQLPYFNSSPAVVGGKLFAIGGYGDYVPMSDIYSYFMDKEEWKLEGTIQQHAIADACTVVLPTEEVMVIGGRYSENYYSNEVLVGNLEPAKGMAISVYAHVCIY